MSKKKVTIAFLCVVLVLLVAAQVQPWSFAIKPIGPTAGEQQARWIEEDEALGREARTLRMIARVRNGGTLPDFNEAVKRNPALADYKRRADDHSRRQQELMKKYPSLRHGW